MTKRTEKGLQSNTETHLKLCSSGPVGVFCFYASTHWTVFTFPLKPQIQLWVATATTQPHPAVATPALPKDLYLALKLGECIYWWSGGEVFAVLFGYSSVCTESHSRWATHQNSTHAVLYFQPKVTTDALGFELLGFSLYFHIFCTSDRLSYFRYIYK